MLFIIYLHNPKITPKYKLSKRDKIWYKDLYGRELISPLKNSIIEFYVHTSKPKERDHFRVEDYEPPLDNFIDVDTTNDSPEESLDKILSEINEKLYELVYRCC